MNIIVFDTETTDLQKPYCYNVGYVVFDTETMQKVVKREFVVEQVWHNTMLFNTAYYADKKEIYIARMRGRTAVLDKWGYVMQKIRRDIVDFEITDGYAYNSDFDERVFAYNCDWFKTLNPLDTIKIHDVRGYVAEVIANTAEYRAFCEQNNLFTESENYSTTAEAVYKFIANKTDFVEEHTALADSDIECDILVNCILRGCEWGADYGTKVAPRVVEKTYIVIDCDNNRHEFAYTSKRKISGQDGIKLTRKTNEKKRE